MIVALDCEELTEHPTGQSRDRRGGFKEFSLVTGFERCQSALVAGVESGFVGVVAYEGQAPRYASFVTDVGGDLDLQDACPLCEERS